MYECDKCKETFESPQALGGHKVKNHNKKVCCEYCDKRFYRSNLERHESFCKYNPKNKKRCKQEVCDSLIENSKKFCSESCAAIYNNKKHPKRKPEGPPCKKCGDPIKTINKKFCSRSCRRVYEKELKFDQIRETDEANFEGVKNRTNERWIKRFLIQKHGEKCMKCGWSKENTHTGNIPIDLHHRNGDHTDNSIENCQLLCPNCHSLTKNYKGAGKKGREFR